MYIDILCIFVNILTDFTNTPTLCYTYTHIHIHSTDIHICQQFPFIDLTFRPRAISYLPFSTQILI